MGEFHLPLIASNLKSNGYLLLIHGLNDFETPGGGVLPIIAYIVTLLPKGVYFVGFKYMKG